MNFLFVCGHPQKYLATTPVSARGFCSVDDRIQVLIGKTSAQPFELFPCFREVCFIYTKIRSSLYSSQGPKAFFGSVNLKCCLGKKN